FGLAGFVGVLGIGAIGAARKCNPGTVSPWGLTSPARSVARPIADGVPGTAADGVGITRPWRVRLFLHPREADFVDWSQNWRCGRIETQEMQRRTVRGTHLPFL